ncbi:MAG: hypothetical protein KBT73_11710 [Marinobacter sp.]|nr:hypothetical protein [Marinobacter sp.]
MTDGSGFQGSGSGFRLQHSFGPCDAFAERLEADRGDFGVRQGAAKEDDIDGTERLLTTSYRSAMALVISSISPAEKA